MRLQMRGATREVHSKNIVWIEWLKVWKRISKKVGKKLVEIKVCFSREETLKGGEVM